MSENAAREDIHSLTGLRFLAALSVAVAHGTGMVLRFSPDQAYLGDWIGRGTAFGMTLFFVLSGFVIHLNYRMSVTAGGAAGIASFVWARFSRLFPLFLLLLTADFALHSFPTADLHRFDVQLRALPYYLLSIQSWLYLPIRDHSLIYTIGTAVPVTWSISTEWFFYLCFPLIAPLVLFLRREPHAVIAAIVWCVIWVTVIATLSDHYVGIEQWAVDHYGDVASASLSPQDSFFRWLFYFSPYVRIGEFILGCIIAQLYLLAMGRPVNAMERVGGLMFQWLAVLSIPLIIVVMYDDPIAPALLIKIRNSFAVAPSIAVLIFCMARYRSSLSSAFASPLMIKLGDASYEIYLIHIPVFALVLKLMAHSFGAQSGMWGSVLWFCLGLAILFSASIGLHTYFEVPIRRRLRALWEITSVSVSLPQRRKWAVAIFALPFVGAFIVAIAISIYLVPLSRDGGIGIISATYGYSCEKRQSNITTTLAKACDGLASCVFAPTVDDQPQPTKDCASEVQVQYLCGADPTVLSQSTSMDIGFHSSLKLDCTQRSTSALVQPAGRELQILSATYGASCGAKQGNVTADLKKVCSGRPQCGYRVDVAKLGDPARGCAKDYRVEYVCGNAGNAVERLSLAAEAGLGSYAVLSCIRPHQ